MKFSAGKRALALLLTAVLTAGVLLPGLPALAAEPPEDPPVQENVTTYSLKDETQRKIYWTQGIEAPKLPEDYQGEGPLTIAMDPKGGWYDLELQEEDRLDGAAAAVNLLSWWLHVNETTLNDYLAKKPVLPKEYQEKAADPLKVGELLPASASQQKEDSPLYALFQKKAGDRAYAPDSYVDLFLNGYALNAKQNKTEDFDPKDPETGYLLPALDLGTLTHRIQALDTFQALGEELQHWLKADTALALGMQAEDGSLRYVNLWGAEFDSDDQLTAIYITDSRDGSGQEKAMSRFVVTPAEETRVQIIDLTDEKAPDFGWENLYTLSSGRDLLEIYEVPVEPQWDEPQYEWTKDRKVCTATREQLNGDMVDSEESQEVKTTQVKAPTAEKPGEVTHVATFQADWAQSQTLSEQIPAENDVKYQWSEDYGTCTASYGDQEVQATVNHEVTKEATTAAKGETTYTAKFDVDWAKTQVETVADIPQLAEQWGEVQYQWSSDNKTCTAYRVRTDDDSIRQSTDPVEVTSSDAGDGKLLLTVDFAAKDESWAWAGKTEKTVDAPKPEPTMGEVTYQWSEDNATCTASATDSEGNTYSAQAKVTSETTKKAGCETEGEMTYTAAFAETWAKTQTKVQATKALGHDWAEPTYRWSDGNRRCEAVRVCKRDESHKETATLQEVTAKQTKEPTEKEAGETTYTATFQEDWAKTQTITMEIPKLSDNWGEVTYTWSDDHRKCTAKRTNADDPNRVQTATAKVSFRRTKEPTETEKGETTYEAHFKELWAKDQKKTVADIPSIQDDSRNDSLWNSPTYEWSEDMTRCTASRSKKSDPSTVDRLQGKVTEEKVKEATCQEPGESVFTATFSKSWAKDQEKTVEIQTGAHDLEPVPEAPATGTTVGLKAHYRCKVCGKLFLDEKGTQEVTRKDLELQAPVMAGNNVVVQGIPEKENTVAIVPDAIRKALDDHPEAKGVQISAGTSVVVYSRETAESVLKEAKRAKKLVLQVKLTNFSDSELTSKQAQSVKKNVNAALYYVSLTDGRKNLEAPCTVMVPYKPVGGGETKVYILEEKGDLTATTAQYNSGYLAWNADTGFFVATEFEAAAAGGSSAGIIVLIVVLVVALLGMLGIGGYFLYKKFYGVDEDDFSDGPQLDQEARERIRTGTAAVSPTVGRPAPQQPAAAPEAPAAETQPLPKAPQEAAPVTQEPEITPEMAAAAAAGASGAALYQGTFESKPSYADKAVQAAHHGQKAPAQPAEPADPSAEEELEELKHWLDEIE